MDWSKPQAVTKLDVAFGGDMAKLLPPFDSLPESFRRERDPWCDFVQKLFFHGGQLPKAKAGIDAGVANGHIRAILGSFQPKHEHKIAGVAWLMSQWYETPEASKKEKAKP